MVSTGEVACLGDDFNEAYLKSLISVGFKMPQKTILLSTGPINHKSQNKFDKIKGCGILVTLKSVR